MFCILVCGVLLGCAGLTVGGLIPNYLSVTNRRNETNQWLQMEIGHEEGQLWDMLLIHSKNYTTAKFSQNNEMTGDKKCPPPGYEQVCGTGYYKLYGKDSQRTWREAEDVCESEGGHLIVIDSKEELMYMKVMAFKHGKESLYFYVGVHDLYKEGDYVTVLNTTVASTKYSTWYPGDPSTGTSYNCAQFYYNPNTHVYGLDILECTAKKGFICEIENL